MARSSTANLSDKHIRDLEPKSKAYKKAVGNPKELYIIVYPSGIKTFVIKHNDTHQKIANFRPGIYSVAEARKDAIDKLRAFQGGAVLEKNKYSFENLTKLYIAQKRKKVASEKYVAQVERMIERYAYPTLKSIDVRNVTRSMLVEMLNKIYTPNTPKQSHLETIKRLTSYLGGIFDIAFRDRYIDYNPVYKLREEFPSAAKFYAKHDIDPRLPAITDEAQIADFLADIKANATMEPQTKRAILLQILCVNRPANTASAKWADIDLEEAVWRIKASEMKTKTAHEIALNRYAIAVLKTQRKFVDEIFGKKYEFVFPSFSKAKHIHSDTLSKALRTLEGGKYYGLATTHGFRATFRTICSKNEAELLKLGIGNNVIETALAHKTSNQIQYAYEREKSTTEQLARLMEWYGEYLNNLCEFEIV